MALSVTFPRACVPPPLPPPPVARGNWDMPLVLGYRGIGAGHSITGRAGAARMQIPVRRRRGYWRWCWGPYRGSITEHKHHDTARQASAPAAGNRNGGSGFGLAQRQPGSLQLGSSTYVQGSFNQCCRHCTGGIPHHLWLQCMGMTPHAHCNTPST